MVEYIHITIRNILLSLFLENIKDFYLEKHLIKAMNIYNKTKHGIIKITPNEIYNSTNPDLFEIIKKKIL